MVSVSNNRGRSLFINLLLDHPFNFNLIKKLKYQISIFDINAFINYTLFSVYFQNIFI